MPFAKTEVRHHNGVPAIFINDKPIHGMTATSTAFGDPQVVRDFNAGGVEVMMIWIEAGIHCWKGPKKYDWTYAEEKLAFFEKHSGDSNWIIRIRLAMCDSWFKHAHPTEVHHPPKSSDDDSVSIANIHSPVWLENVSELLHDFVSWLKTTRWAPRIIGFMLNAGATEEWLAINVSELYSCKYGPVITREFRNWLRREYKDDVNALREAWSGKDVSTVLHRRGPDKPLTFDNANPPVGHIRKGSHIWGPYSLRDPLYERQNIDYYRYLNETLADSLISVCRTVKEAAGSPIICGGFHSYLWWETGIYSYIQEYGHTCLQRLKESPYVDFVSDITSYDDRYPGGPSGYLGLPHSLNLSGKLHYTEVDLVTINQLPEQYRKAWAEVDADSVPVLTAEPAIPDRLWKWNVNYCGRDMDEQVAVIQREHMHNLITGTPYWWFDIRSHDYQAPEIVTAMKHLSNISKQAVNWDRSSISEAAFIVSEETPFFQAAMNGELLRFELESNHKLLIDRCNRQWGLCGFPFDTYELNDLANPDFPGEQYKLFIFLNCAHISPKAAAGIRRWQNGNRVFCWTFAPGVTALDGIDPAKNRDVIGITLGWRNQRQNIHINIEDTGHPLTNGGNALSFGTEGSVGPVFFADDPEAQVLGRLRDGGEPGFAVKQLHNWRSVYLAMHNFGPSLLRNLMRWSGGHVWCDTDDVLYANRSIVSLHTASAGQKTIQLPKPAVLTDLWSGKRSGEPASTISVQSHAYRTRAWRME